MTDEKRSCARGLAVHTYKIPIKGVKKKILYHFSDVHLTEQDALSTPQECRRATEQSELWITQRYDFAREHGEQYTEAQTQSSRAHLHALLAEAAGGDALVMTGDICDYISGANLRATDAALQTFPVPFLLVLGNHEEAAAIPEQHPFAAAKAPVQCLDLGDVLLFGIDNSQRRVTREQNEALLAALSEGKPVLIAMHVPIMTEGNRQDLLACGEYFQLNHAGAPAEVEEFIRIIRCNADRIPAVLAGHLHFASNTELAPGVMQYVSTQGVLGNLNRYEIGCD